MNKRKGFGLSEFTLIVALIGTTINTVNSFIDLVHHHDNKAKRTNTSSIKFKTSLHKDRNNVSDLETNIPLN